MSLDFQGKSIMVEKIDQAVGGACPKAITDCLRDALCEMIPDPRIQLPACVFEHHPDHYCRRLLHQDHRHGYSILAMTWGPGQGTPVHDHAGMWCVEAVWQGQIEVVQYELMEQAGERFRLEPRTTMRTGVGSAGSLIPPHEYHTIANPDQRQAAVTLHIYAGEMDHCSVFAPEGSDWYYRQDRRLSLDAA
ncbi:MAG: cysteine dioxygenase [Wenzhouxiangella sp.]|nr:MAG: cysteine dioxygenase [Wenzhouxiangella sp.]